MGPDFEPPAGWQAAGFDRPFEGLPHKREWEFAGAGAGDARSGRHFLEYEHDAVGSTMGRNFVEGEPARPYRKSIVDESKDVTCAAGPARSVIYHTLSEPLLTLRFLFVQRPGEVRTYSYVRPSNQTDIDASQRFFEGACAGVLRKPPEAFWRPYSPTSTPGDQLGFRLLGTATWIKGQNTIVLTRYDEVDFSSDGLESNALKGRDGLWITIDALTHETICGVAATVAKYHTIRGSGVFSEAVFVVRGETGYSAIYSHPANEPDLPEGHSVLRSACGGAAALDLGKPVRGIA